MGWMVAKLQQHLVALAAEAGTPAPSPAAVLAEGQAALAAGRPDEALARLEAALAAGSDPVPTQAALAKAHLALGRQEAFFAACQAWRLAAANDAAGLAALARTLLDAGHRERAGAVLEDAVRRHPRHADLHVLLGLAAQHARRWPEATRHYEEAVRLHPRSAVARHGLVRVFLAAQDLQRAAAQLHYLRLLVPDYVPAFTLAAEIAERHGHWREVVAELEPLIELDLADADVLFRLGFAHWKLGAPALAAEYFTGCLALNAQRLDACFFLAQHAERMRQPERALELYRRMAGHAQYREWAEAAAARVEASLAQVHEALAG